MKKKRTIPYLLVLILCLPTLGQTEELKTILTGLSRKYSHIKTFSGEFFQETTHPAIKKKSLSQGKLLFKRPNMFRWLMLNPPGEEVISDGTTLWIYQPELSQTIKTSTQRGMPALVVRLIGSLQNIERDFSVEYMGEVDNTVALELRPKEEMGPVTRLTLFVDSKELTVVKIEIKEEFGRTTSIRFTRLALNPILDDSLFQYKPGPGVTVVEP